MPEVLSPPDKFQELDSQFLELSPQERVALANEKFAGKLVLATTFGPTAPVLLKTVVEEIPDIPVINIRHGYETEETLRHEDFYKNALSLDLRTYGNPRKPVPSDPLEFDEYQRYAKVEPFQRMIDELRPLAYFSGSMRWQSEQRSDLPFIEAKGSVFTIYPLADLSEEDVDEFFEQTGLPRNINHFDPTKGQDQKQECQLNTSVYK